MSLRLRLTLLYASLLGGVLLIFGVLVYLFVSTMLVSQIDSELARTYSAIIPGAQVNSRGNLDVLTLPSLDLTDNVFFQIWGRNGKLSATNISQITDPLDPIGMRSAKTVFRNSYVSKVHVRVLSVPLQVNGRQIGVLQIGSSLSLIDTTQQAMLVVLAVTALVSMLLAGAGAWLTTGRALAPLETVTQVATHITRADDLSRRIPFSGQPSDEVGQLIVAFNETMARLETLFNAQRRFLADVSHELRTPLTVIKGNVGLLKRMGSADSESLESIDTEVDRLARLVGDLLLLAQAESGKIPLDLRPVELDTMLMEVFQQMRVLAGNKLQVRISDLDQVQVMGDPDRLKQ
ncbi:MAG TPA: histidine kinase dimerization/phospho-acceptor domain-containing protein, partial [Anaerolineaceae bacterium]